jgi:hypothetical protein
MRRFVVSSLSAFGVFVALSLTPAFAQHGGGHGGGGGGGSSHGGGGGFHSSGPSGGGFSHGSGGPVRGGGLEGGGRSMSGGGASRGGNVSRGGGAEAARGSGSSRAQSSNVRAAINDGQWHSFGNSGSRANSTLSARNTVGNGISGNGWRSFGSARGGAAFGGGFRGEPGFGFRGGFGRGCCFGGFGFGFGFGWPYWGLYGPAWAFAWDPWWYGPYYYGPWAGYGYYPGYVDYSYDWSNNPPPYRPDSSYDNHAQGYPARPSADDDDYGVNVGTNENSNGSAENVGPVQSVAPPRRPAANPETEPSLVPSTLI